MNKLDSIQALRGLAALLVVLHHTLVITRGSDADVSWSSLWEFGAVGVDVFFMVSGYIMFHIRDRYITETRALPGLFLYKRVLRVLPPYWIYTILVLALFIAAPGLFQGEAPNYARSFLLIPDDKPFLLMVGWTLSYEVYFYIVFAFTLGSFSDSRTHIAMMALWFVGIGILVRALGFTGPIADFLASFMHAEFIFGGVLYIVVSRQSPKSNTLALTCLLTGGALYLHATSQGSKLARVEIINFAQYFLTAALFFVAFIAARGWLATILIRPLHRIGDASYSLYLSHWLALNALGLVMKKIGFFHALPFTIFAVGASCLYAVLTYRLVERRIPEVLDTMRKRVMVRLESV